MKSDLDQDILDGDLDYDIVDVDDFNVSIWKRLIHYLIDSFIFFWIGIIGMVIAFPNSDWESRDLNNAELIIFLFFYFACWFVFEFSFNATPAKWLTKSKVVMNNGSKPTLLSILIRSFIRVVPFDFVTLFTSEKRTIHDMVSKTKVVSVKYNSL